MFFDVYVGRLDDPEFVANKRSPAGAVPASCSPPFPCGRAAFHELVRRIERHLLPGEATQHIAYVAPASKEQIARFYADLFGTNPLLHTGPDPDPPTEASRLRTWIKAMDDDGQWCLVACE